MTSVLSRSFSSRSCSFSTSMTSTCALYESSSCLVSEIYNQGGEGQDPSFQVT